MTGAGFAALLRGQGFDFFTGVPCSLIEDLLAVLEQSPDAPYVAAVREDVAVGLAGGAWFAGRRPAVLMQNSGLGTSLNALASFSLMYGLPVLLLVTWRGYQGKDAPEHILMGEISEPILGLLGIPHRVLSSATCETDVAWAATEMATRQAPVALLVPPKVFEAAHDRPGGAHDRPGVAEPRASETAHPRHDPISRSDTTLSRRAAMEIAMKQLGDEALVSANGYISRDAFSIADRPQNFYMIGSMGLASSIGLGLALGGAKRGAQPPRPIVVFDGDGNLLMSLGILAMIGGLAPSSLVHCVFDNEVYGSTGNQRSPSREVRLDRVAAGAGFRTAVAVSDETGVAGAVRAALGSPGPHFILVKVTTEETEVPRIPYTPTAMRDRFRAALEPA